MSERDVLAALEVTRDPALFFDWWQNRSMPNDNDVKEHCIAAGLICRGASLLWLTRAGKKFHSDGDAALRARQSHPAASEGGNHD